MIQSLEKIDAYEKFVFKGKPREAGIKLWKAGLLDEAKKQVKNIIRNIVIGILIFLLPSLINLVFDIADDIISPGETSDFSNCVNCLTDPNDSSECIIQESDD